MFEKRGRQNLIDYVGDKRYVIKNPVKLHNSIAVLLPKDWLEAVAMGREIKRFLVDTDNDTFLIIKPDFEGLPAGHSPASD